MLSTLLKGTGAVLLVVGAASIESPSMVLPTALALAGCVLMIIGMREDGDFRKKNRPR